MAFNDKRYHMPSIVLALLTSVVAIAVEARTQPKLVVGIMIDGLDSRYIDMLRSQMGEGGFNRLLDKGVVIANADYGTNVDATAAAAMLMTGASPATTSITGAKLYDREAMRQTEAMRDPDVLGNFTNIGYSPKSLSVSTIADEVRIAGGGVTRVFSIAPDAAQAVILAGHSANCALWLNQDNGNWATSTYYKETPATLTQRNRVTPLSVRLDTMSWAPLRESSAYPGLPDHLTRYPFRYVFQSSNRDRFAMFAASPLVNTEITDFAGHLIDDLHLGTADGIDMVNLSYTLRPYDYTRSDDNRYELIDSYLRLDKDIEKLLNKVNRTVGNDAVIFIAATPPPGTSRRDDERWNIPYGEFSTKKAKSLLNMYLIAVYGNGDWVKSYNDGQFYLNQKLINDRNLDATAVRTEASSFLKRMSGVDRVYTLDDILSARGNSHLEALSRNNDPATAGDLYVEVDPGWEIIDDISVPASEKRVHYVKRLAPATAPVYILAPETEPRVIDTPVDIRVIAPTVARLLRIRSPNAANLPALVL